MTEGINHPGSLWNRILRVARTEGAQGLARRVVARAKEGVRLLYCYLLVYRLAGGAAAPQARVDLEIEEVTPAKQNVLHELAQIYQVPEAENGILDQLADDESCFVGRVNGRIAGYVWIRRAGVVREFKETLFSLDTDEVYYHDAYVLPEMRGNNIYTAMKAFTGQVMARVYGKQRAISFVRHDNKSSLSASRKLGAQCIGRIGYIKVFGKRFRYLIRHRPGSF